MDDNEVLDLINEFLIESNENLARLEQEMLELEQRPADLGLLGSVFRTIHTIKGTCGFFGFGRLESVTHLAESILNQLRNGERALTPPLVSLILEAVDAVKTILANIEATHQEGEDAWGDLRARLQHACDQPAADAPAAVPEAPTPPPAVTPPPAIAAPPPVVAATPRARVPRRKPAAGGRPPRKRARKAVTPPPDLQPPAVAAAPAIVAAPAPVSVSVVTPPVNAVPPKPAPTQGQEKEASAQKTSIVDSTIRVDVGLLDKLMNLVGELVLARNQILQFTARREEAALTATSQRLNLITTQLQEGVMKTRMQPIGVVWNKLPRVVRDMASGLQKQIRVEMDGAETELDKSIIEAIKDPLTHIVRNCCDHGIETPALRAERGKPAEGRLLLRAYHEGGQVNIEISDDGAGIDPQRLKDKAVQKGVLRPEAAERMGEREAVNLVFLPGLSTAERVTNISGRGVGMDVVKTNIEKIGGAVDLVSRVGEGTTVKIKIPLTLAIIPGLVVHTGLERYVIPQVSLQELVRLEGDAGRRQIELIKGTPVYRRRGGLLPIAHLHTLLGIDTLKKDSDVVNIVVLQADGCQFGLVVDGINDTQEIVVKPLGKQLKGLSAYAGATIMGDGRVALILDVHGLAEMSGVLSTARDQARAEAERGHRDQAGTARQSYLVFRAGSFERLAVPLSLVARLEEFPLSRIEQAAGRLVVQYRGQLLRLVPLASVLQQTPFDPKTLPEHVQVVVFSDRDRVLGLLVDQVVDILDDTMEVRQGTGRTGLAGSAVIGKRVTDFVDLSGVFSAVGENWFGSGGSENNAAATVMVADASPFSRALIKNSLELVGHRVVEASTADEALGHLEKQNVDVLVADLDLPPDGASELMKAVRTRPALAGLRALAMTPRLATESMVNGDGFDEYLVKYDREAMLRAIARVIEGRVDEALAPELVSGRS